MSSFMVSNKTLNIITNYILDNRPRELEYALYWADWKPEFIYEMLRDMNHRALCERYGGEVAQEMWDVNKYNYDPAEKIPSYSIREEKAQIVTRISCFLYQCNEGSVTRDELYKDLEKWCGKIAVDFVLHEADLEKWWD